MMVSWYLILMQVVEVHIIVVQTMILQGPDVAAVDNTAVAVDMSHHTQMQYLPILLVLLDTDAVDVHANIVEDSYYCYYIPSHSDADHTCKGLGGRDNYCMGWDQVLHLGVDIDTDLAAALAVGLGLVFVDIAVVIVVVAEDCFEYFRALEPVHAPAVAVAAAVALCFDNNMDGPAPVVVAASVVVREFFDSDH